MPFLRETEYVAASLLMRGTDGAGDCYTIPMGLCYGADSQALTVVRREPAGRYPLPCGEPEGH